MIPEILYALSKVDAYKAADTWGEFVNIQGDEALSIDGLHEELSKADIKEVKDALQKGIYLLRQGNEPSRWRFKAASFVWHPEIFYFRVLFENGKQ